MSNEMWGLLIFAALVAVGAARVLVLKARQRDRKEKAEEKSVTYK